MISNRHEILKIMSAQAHKFAHAQKQFGAFWRLQWTIGELQGICKYRSHITHFTDKSISGAFREVSVLLSLSILS